MLEEVILAVMVVVVVVLVEVFYFLDTSLIVYVNF